MESKELNINSGRLFKDRDHAIKQIGTKINSSLPECLQDNKIRADRLLFKEAQYFYTQRRNSMQQQILIDNLQYLMLKEVLSFTEETPDQVIKTQRVKKTLDTAKKVVIAHETQEQKQQRLMRI